MKTRESNAAMTAAIRLPVLVDQAAKALAGARTSAEILDARDLARAAYSAAKTASRFARAKKAYDDILPRIHAAQAGAIEIETAARMRLADEYDAAQARGEVRTRADNQHVPKGNKLAVADIPGLTRKEIHEARKIRDAERANPGIVKTTLKQALAEGKEPIMTAMQREIIRAARLGSRYAASLKPKPKKKEVIELTPIQKAHLNITSDVWHLYKEYGKLDIADILGGCFDPAPRHQAIFMENFRTGLTWLNRIMETYDATIGFRSGIIS